MTLFHRFFQLIVLASWPKTELFWVTQTTTRQLFSARTSKKKKKHCAADEHSYREAGEHGGAFSRIFPSAAGGNQKSELQILIDL